MVGEGIRSNPPVVALRAGPLHLHVGGAKALGEGEVALVSLQPEVAVGRDELPEHQAGNRSAHELGSHGLRLHPHEQQPQACCRHRLARPPQRGARRGHGGEIRGTEIREDGLDKQAVEKILGPTPERERQHL